LGCSDDGEDTPDGSSGTAASGGESSSSGGAGGGAPTQSFVVRIDNVSGDAPIATAISPGVWLLHGTDDPLFTAGMKDRGDGLEAIAEDGDPEMLAGALGSMDGVTAHGAFDTPVGSEEPGPAFPGGSFELTIEAPVDQPDTRLSLATMFGNSNDVFFAPAGEGIRLFNDDGNAIESQDVTDMVSLWDVGTEVNQAPNSGPVQAPRQGAPNTGPMEGRLSAFSDSTRALPSAAQVARVDVVASGDGFDVTVTNVSGPGGPVTTPISPVFYAVHNENWSLFQPGTPASAGIEAIAEDGNSAVLVETETGAAGVALAGAITIPNGAAASGPALPGESFTFHVVPSDNARYLSIASMFGQSNDAFIGFGPEGVALLDEQGNARAAAEIAADVQKKLILWDAGTEANEVPGAGATQAPRQGTPNTGPADPDTAVRRYGDATNDLAGPMAGGALAVTVASAGSNMLSITIANTSAGTPYPTKLSPVVYAVHDGLHEFFTDGETASPGVERLAEDGNPSTWVEELMAANVQVSGKIGDAPIAPGESFQLMITVTPDARVLDLATMIATSNDTFVSLGPLGVELADTQGDLRPIAAINADIAAALTAWDAGTEANQAAALGPDQAPRQAAPNTGPSEGDGLVRTVDQVWAFPATRDVLRVTITAQK
jgi:hypothetical protein